jgi:hypothetical protein
MKKLSTIIIAMALVLGLGQCKKQETPATTDPEDGLVYITVNVGDNGAKHEVYPNTGAYVFTNGDTLYVGNNGHYVGKLGYKDGAFSGSITSPSTEDYLHFYFLGGLTPSAAPTAGSTTDFTVSIADQSSKLPILSYGQSTQKYTDANATYSTVLRNKCGLVEFATNEIHPVIVVSISGMKSEATINFNDNTIAPTSTTGDITLYAESATSRWAILLPGDEVSSTATAEGYNSTDVTVPAVAINNYLHGVTAVSFEMTVAAPIGVINSKFSVSATKQVYFSQGNLQYNKTTNKWSFMEHQYDMVETLGQFVGENYSDQNIVSIFGWGTSGYAHGAIFYLPWITAVLATKYNPYGDYTYNLYDQTGQADWGYNAIANGGNKENCGWRTMTNTEWGYVFNGRTDAASKWGHGSVNGVNGMILLPDTWTLPAGLTFTPGNSDWANVYNLEQWAQMEASGAVFLPAAGTRAGQPVYEVGTHGRYWTSSSVGGDGYAYAADFNNSELHSNIVNRRDFGSTVRLVRNTE